MLARELEKHLDLLDVLEIEKNQNIEKIILNVDRDLLIDNPKEALADVMEAISDLMENEYIPRAIKIGDDLSKLLERYDRNGKEILVDPKKESSLNKDQLNDEI